jgi:phosphoglycerol transferase
MLTVLSAGLFILGLYLYQKASPSKILMGVFFIMALGSIILFVGYGATNYFTGAGLDEATIYHLTYGLEGAGFLEYSSLIVVIVSLLVLSAFMLSRCILKRKASQGFNVISGFLAFSALSLSLLLNPASIGIYELEIDSPLFSDGLNQQVPISFQENYRRPYIKSSSNKNKNKNIIVIYAESLERTYFDETVFPGLINGLRELESVSTYFTNIQQVDGTGWTVAGMTASQCGIPLVTPSHGNSMSGMDQFLSSAVCIGDLLNEKGYQLNYLGGSSLDFAGKGKLYKTHGFSVVLGREELVPKLEDQSYKTGWGLYDDSLFGFLYSRFIELSEIGDKFGLFTLTLDTHHPNGHPSKSCADIKYKDGSNAILNSVACSDHLISNFIKKIITSPYADETIVVLVSDHLAMKNTASDLLQKQERKNLFMIIDPSQKESLEVGEVGSTLDIGATFLPFIGYSGDIGLGRNLLSVESSEENRLFIHSSLRRWRQTFARFWAFPKIENSLEINIEESFVRIDKREFKMPILIELNEKLESTLKFEFHKSAGYGSLIGEREKLPSDKYFLLVDKCMSAKVFDSQLGGTGFCLLAAKGSQYSRITRLERNITYNAKQVRALFEL